MVVFQSEVERCEETKISYRQILVVDEKRFILPGWSGEIIGETVAIYDMDWARVPYDYSVHGRKWEASPEGVTTLYREYDTPDDIPPKIVYKETEGRVEVSIAYKSGEEDRICIKKGEIKVYYRDRHMDAWKKALTIDRYQSLMQQETYVDFDPTI